MILISVPRDRKREATHTGPMVAPGIHLTPRSTGGAPWGDETEARVGASGSSALGGAPFERSLEPEGRAKTHRSTERCVSSVPPGIFGQPRIMLVTRSNSSRELKSMTI